MSFSPRNILIIGGGHGLGLGLVKKALSTFPEAKVVATYRQREKAQDLLDSSAEAVHLNPLIESDVEEFCKTLDSVDLVINSVGMLQNNEGFGPEKSLRNMDLDYMTEIFQVNAFVTPILGKYLRTKFSKESPSVFATLSAMVGSIEENEVGGWYSYRASKTALNMFMKTMAIEFKRSNLKTTMMAIHPGTTETDLSTKFLKGIKHKIWTPDTAADNILRVISKNAHREEFLFKNWDDRDIAN